jgi:Major Facilitator Superfamily
MAVRPARAGPPPVTTRTRPIVAGLMLSMFLVALDGTIVSTAMPSIVGSLGGFALYAWVPSIYLLTTAVTTPLYGKLADLFGRKRVLFVGIGLFLLGSVLSGAAPSMVLLILFRALQGLGAGAVMPVTTTIIGDIFTLEQRARVDSRSTHGWDSGPPTGTEGRHCPEAARMARAVRRLAGLRVHDLRRQPVLGRAPAARLIRQPGDPLRAVAV